MRKNTFFAALMAFAALVATADTVLTFSPCAETAQTSNSIPTDVSSPADGDYTWEAWFKPSNLNLGENRMVAQTGWAWNVPGRLMLAVRKHKNNPGALANKPILDVFFNNNSTVRLLGQTEITAGWHHAALVRQGTTLSIYLDGVFEASTNNYTVATPSGADTAPFLIGPAFYGSLAEVRLWNVARTAAEIAASKDKRLAGTEDHLIGYWPLDEGGTSVEPVNKVTGIAATNVTIDVAGVSRTVGYNQGEGLGAAAYEDDAGLALTPVPAAGMVYTTTAAGGKWSEIAWTPSTPVSGTGARIVLAGAGAFENDLGTFSLNALTFSATASLSGDGLVFAASDGENPTLATTGAVTNDVNVAMRLDAPLTWTGDNTAGSMRLNGALSGTGDLIHDPTEINIIDYINGDNSAWSGNIDQRLSFIVISNSVNLGTGTYYCTNETCRVKGRDTLRIYGNNTITNRFYLGSEGGGGAGARVDIFGVTTFTEPFGVYNTRVGILDVTTFEGGIYNWSGNGGNNAVFQSGTGNAAKGVVHINGPLNIRGVLYCNALETSNNKLKIFLHSPTNVFAGFLGIRGGVLSMGGEGCYPTNAYFGGQTMTYSWSFLGGVLDLNGYSQVLGYHVGYADSLTNSSFKIRNSVAATVPTVRVMQTADNLTSPLVTEGPMHFIKDGAKLLAITNSFGVGGTLEVAAGTLRLTAPSEGRLADTVSVREGAMLDLGGNTFACGLLVLNGGTVYNGTLAVDEAGLGDGTMAAALVGADIAVTGAVAYAASVSASKTLSTNGLVFYMPFDDPATYLTDEGPDKVVFGRTVSSGTVACDMAEKRFGEGALRLNGSTQLAPTGGNLISGTTFPASVPHGNAPYTVAIYYKINPSVANTVEVSMLGYGTDAATRCNNYSFNKAVTINGIAYNAHTVINHWYHSADLWLPLGHNVSRKDGNWHSLVTTWDGAIFRTYDDGMEVTPIPKNAANRTVTTPPNVGTTLFILGAQIRKQCTWNGWLDEIAIFDRAISADEALAYHLNGVKGGTAPTQALAVAAGATATVGNTLTNGLAFYMPFESEETFLTDEGPDKVTLSCQTTVKHTTLGTATCDTFEKRFGRGALRLDGKSPLVPVGGTFPPHVPTGAAAYTFACAFKAADTSTGRGLIGYGDRANNKGNNYAWNNATLLNNYYWNCDMRPKFASSVLNGEWHTLVATWDGNGVWRFWVDGAEPVSYDMNRTTYPNVQTAFFWVGATLNGNAWNGWIDELAIWNRALTEEEALAYNVRGIGGGATYDDSARIEVAPGGTLKTAGDFSLAGTLAAAGTVDGDLTLADGATVEEQAGGAPTVTGKVTIEGTGAFVPRAYPTSAGTEWTILTALGGFAAGADGHARTWTVPGLANTFLASGTASGTTFKMLAYPRGTVILFR
ncbi:MAG: hypothetical protein IJ658_08300 [Kiritimatiellae bacterium]|nr:hypothetical protein [Kiritimatiellia bacterium]